MALVQSPHAPHAREWTAEDLAGLPDENRYEIIDGSLHAYPRPGPRQEAVADRLQAALSGASPPGWRMVRDGGVRVPGGYLRPDLLVLRPAARPDPAFADPSDVALVVQIESPASRRLDRLVKPVLYAEAGIESFWRVELTAGGPVAHLYSHRRALKFLLHRSVNPGETVLAEYPFQVQVSPSGWCA